MIPGSTNLLLVGSQGYQISRSLRFNSADSAYLNRTPASSGNRQTFTISFWIKKVKTGGGTLDDAVFTGNIQNGFVCNFRNDLLSLYDFYAASGGFQIWSARVFRDPSAWYHIVIAVDTTQATDSNRIKVYINGIQEDLSTWNLGAGASRYPSLNATFDWNNTNNHKIGYTATYNYLNGYLTEFHNIDGQALTPSSFGETDTITGVWRPKKYAGTYGTNGFYLNFASNTLGTNLTSTATLTAPFGGTAENARTSNGVYLTSNTTTGSGFTFLQEDFGSVKQLTRYNIGAFYFTGGASTFQLQYSTDGSSWTNAASLSVTATGTNYSGNINVNARYVRLQAVAFGVNGQASVDEVVIYQDGLGLDSSGNGNNWTPNNFSVTAGAGNDSLTDSPTLYGSDTGAGGEVRGNYCTLNGAVETTSNGKATLSNGNLECSVPRLCAINGSFGVTSGKWYWEVQATDLTNGPYGMGVFAIGKGITHGDTQYIFLTNTGYLYTPGDAANQSSWGPTYNGTTDITGLALDADNKTLGFNKNGGSFTTFNYSSYSSMTSGVTPAWKSGGNLGTSGATFNFGQRQWAYTPPAGYRALCTTNLPEPTLVKGSSYFNVELWSGSGTTNARTGLGFSPDLVWVKARGTNANSHYWYDAVRGVTKYLNSDATAAEGTETGGQMTSFDSNGFTVATNDSHINKSGNTYVAWCWDAGSSTVTNTSGTISSQVRANASSGFSVVTYTGTGSNATVGHGLGVAPSMVIVKNRNTSSYGWFVWHTAFSTAGNTDYINLNLVDQKGSGGAVPMWNSTVPSSSVFSIGTYGGVNGITNTYVAYCFSAVAGYSAFGSYTGNGSSDGPFVFTGFRPKLLIWKRTDSTGNWFILDAARNTYNVVDKEMYPDQSNAESTFTDVDFLSNGFKLRASAADRNGSGATFVYCCFAENPFKYSLAR